MSYNINNILESLSDDTYELLDNNQLFLEGAVQTSKKNRLDNYLKKYGYHGETTINYKGKEYKSGFITYKGMNIRIIKNFYSTGAIMLQLTNDGPIEPTIGLDKIFESLKNTQRMDAILLHEIGHLKLNHHNEDPSDVGNEERSKRKSNHDIYKQYESNTISDKHRTSNEFEADRYAKVQQGTDKYMRQALYETTKKYSKQNVDNAKDRLKKTRRDAIRKFDTDDYAEIDKHYDGERDKISQSADQAKSQKYNENEVNRSNAKKEAHKNNVEIVDKQASEFKIDTKLHRHNQAKQLETVSRSKALKDKRVDDNVYTDNGESNKNDKPSTNTKNKTASNNIVKTESTSLFNIIIDITDI